MAEADYRYGSSQPGSKQFGGEQEPLGYPTYHYVYFNSTSIEINWTILTGTESYDVQASEASDFSGTLMLDTTTSKSYHLFTDSGTNDTKRWWRWRATGSRAWSEVGSYWINTSAANNISVGRNIWKMFDPDDIADIYILPLYPNNQITQNNLLRFKQRNRLGTLLSEYVTGKSGIVFDYNANGYMTHTQFTEHRRFNEEIKTLFLATFKDSDFQDPVPNIWKVQYAVDPEFSMIALGRPDLMAGSINFEET